MRSVIQQSVVLPATPEILFEMYLDPAAHSAITGFPVTIGAKPGAEFRAFGDQLSGEILSTVRPRLIVQSWRSTKFHGGDPDSTLILMFANDPADATRGRIDLVHLDVPDHDYQDVIEGWQKYYWALGELTWTYTDQEAKVNDTIVDRDAYRFNRRCI